MSGKPKTVVWDRKMLVRFKKALYKANVKYEEQFIFEGNEYLTSYAKYLVEHLNLKLK